jgi:uncharacterized protein (TIGR02285 family)
MRRILDGAFFFFFLALLIGAAGAASAGAKPVVYWPYFNLPPHFIVNGDRPEGMGIDVALELQKEMPEYEHVFIQASPQRIFEELRTGRERFVAIGLLKTSERESYVLYSDIPCRVAFSMQVVMRRDELERLAPDGKASVAALIADKELSLGYIPGLNYGSLARCMDLRTSREGGVRAVTARNVGQLLEMLAEKRIDWFVHGGLGIWYIAGEQDMLDRIAVVDASECPPTPVFGYLACPRTAQGKETMEHINQAMDRLVESGRLYSILKRWIPARFDTAFDCVYTRSMAPGRHPAGCGEACCAPGTAQQ